MGQIPSLASLSIAADSYDDRCDLLSFSIAGSCGGRHRAAIQRDGTLYYEVARDMGLGIIWYGDSNLKLIRARDPDR